MRSNHNRLYRHNKKEKKKDNSYLLFFIFSHFYPIVFKEILNNLTDQDKEKLFGLIKNEISDAYSKEKINELHYTLLKEKLSIYEKDKL